MTGILHLFKAKSGHRLVVPEHLVFREDLANTRTPPARDVDLSDPAAVTREEGKTERQFIAEQERALKAAEEAKRKEAKKKPAGAKRKEAKKKVAEEKSRKTADENTRKEKRGNTLNPELRELKVELLSPIESFEFNLSAQQEAIKAFEAAKKKKEQNLASTNTEQGRENLIQKQHSWHPGSDPTYETIPDPVPRHNRQKEGAAANVPVDHERVHQQQRGHGGHGGYPPTYPHPPQDQDPHRNIGQTHEYPPWHGNTRPKNVQPPQPQRDMRRVNSHNQMASRSTGGQDYVNRETLEYLRSQRNDQSNQPPQGNQWQGNFVNPQQPGAQQYHNVQYQQPPSGQEFGGNPNTIYPPPNNEAYGHPPDHDTPGGHHQTTPSQVSQEFNASVGSSNPYNLGVGSNIQVASVNPNDPQHYGVIRWTGRVAGVDGQVAGIELVSIIIHVY